MLRRSACLFLLLFVACDSSTEQPTKLPPLTREQLLDPTSCKDCHPKHYAEWSSSMHAYASKDPVFLAMNRRGQEENQLGPFCVNCHAPMAVKENAITDYSRIEELPDHLQGVTCYFCHNATEVGPDHFNGNVQLADDTTMRASLNRAQIPSVHKVQYSVNHDNAHIESATMCGTCHDIKLPPPSGFELERTFQEYQQTFFAKSPGFQSCQTCHMDVRPNDLAAQKSGYPGVVTGLRDVHEHLFPGVDVALTDGFPGNAAMRSAVEECKLRDSIQYLTVDLLPPTARFMITMETTAGHAQPSGATQDRRMWMEVVGTDVNGTVVYQAGQIADGQVEQPPGTTHPCMMREHTLDANGNEVHMFWQAASSEMRDVAIPLPLMPIAGTHSRTCTFNAPGVTPIAHLALTLRMRPVGVDVLQDLVASGHLAPDVVSRMPTFTVWTRQADYDPTTNRYLVDNAHPDCDKYKCLLDPSSSHCSAAATAANAGAAGATGSVAGAATGVAGTSVTDAAGSLAPVAGAPATR